MQKKRIIALVVTAVMALSSVSVFAEWNFAGYDTTDLTNIGKIYNEVIDGNYTSKVKVEPLPASAIEWKAEGYELSYPHAGYERLYLEGNAQLVTRYNNMFPQWETRFADCYWEIGGNHKIWQRQQTNVPGYGWLWDYGKDADTDAKLYVPTTRNEANVKYSFENYGVGPYDLKGNLVGSDVLAMYARFGLEGVTEIFNNPIFAPESLSAIDRNTGKFVVTDEMLANYVGSIQAKIKTGPAYPVGTVTKNAADEYLIHGENWTAWHDDTVKWGGGMVTWTKPQFEAKEPYLYYQYLVVNGLVFDGRGDTPVIWRYTGGKATPKVEWKYAFSEAAAPGALLDYIDDRFAGSDSSAPWNVIEFKYIDGKIALDENGYPIYRVPTGEYANIYVKVTPTEIQYWLKDDVKDVMLCSINRTSTTGSYIGYAPGAVLVSGN